MPDHTMPKNSAIGFWAEPDVVLLSEDELLSELFDALPEPVPSEPVELLLTPSLSMVKLVCVAYSPSKLLRSMRSVDELVESSADCPVDPLDEPSRGCASPTACRVAWVLFHRIRQAVSRMRRAE